MKTDSIIKKQGISILREKLGPVDAERFIMLCNREKFDYTSWRQNLFEDKDLEDLAEEAENYSKDR